MIIDYDTYKIKDINFYDIKTSKRQIVIANSLRKNENHITRLMHKEIGNTKKWNTFTIRRDGKIFNHYDPNYYSDFLNIKDADKQSISIVLENMCGLIINDNSKYVNWLNEECDVNRIVEKKILGFNYWEMYSNEQIEACGELCKILCDRYNIEKNVIEFQNYHADVFKFNGILFKTNYIKDDSGINPTLNIDMITTIIKNNN